MKKSELRELIREIIKESNYQVYHRSYTDAIEAALKYVKTKGYEVDEDDIFNNITTGPGRPKNGKTVKHSLGLIKNGKPQKKMLQIQITEMFGKYELNLYIN